MGALLAAHHGWTLALADCCVSTRVDGLVHLRLVLLLSELSDDGILGHLVALDRRW